ncbi:MAG: hypothetical protein Q9208_001813 [Pyrenodesmia sp. 3 TL-2023]
MQYLTFITAALALAGGASAGSFSLVQKNTRIRGGCDLKIDDVCGCKTTLSIHNTFACDKLPKVWTGGDVCGGKWQLSAENPQKTIQFRGKDCHWGCNLPTLKALDPDDPLNKQSPGAKCDALQMGRSGMDLGKAKAALKSKSRQKPKPKPKKGGR